MRASILTCRPILGLSERGEGLLSMRSCFGHGSGVAGQLTLKERSVNLPVLCLLHFFSFSFPFFGVENRGFLDTLMTVGGVEWSSLNRN